MWEPRCNLEGAADRPNRKPRTDRKADSEGAGGGLGEEGDVTGLPKKLSNLKGAGMGDNTPHWFESMPMRVGQDPADLRPPDPTRA